MNPPIITTTAATPQDSPITTLAHGMSFSECENNYCLKPPSVVGSVKALNNLLLPEPLPNKRKMENASMRNANNATTPTATIELEPKASISNIKMENRYKDAGLDGRIDTNEYMDSKATRKHSKKGRSSTKRKEKSNRDGDLSFNERIDAINGAHTSSNKNSIKRTQNHTIKNTNKVTPNDQQICHPNDLHCYGNQASNQYFESNQSQSQQRIHGRGSVAYRRRISTIDPQGLKRLANLDIKQLEELRTRALQRDGRLPPTNENTDTKSEPPIVVHSFIREPIKFTTAALKKQFESFTEGRETYSLYIFSESNKFRKACDWFVTQKWFDNVILLFIALNCITLAMERPNIPNKCPERYFLSTANYIFTFVFTLEMFVKVIDRSETISHLRI